MKTESSSRSKNLKTGCLFLFIALAFYAILGFVISAIENLPKNNGYQVDKSGSSGWTQASEGCSAQSYLINDGVCDEVTNRERCLFDGGDCCLDSMEKQTHYCTDCTCRKKIVQNDFDKLKDKYDLVAFKSNAEAQHHLYESVKLFHDVDNHLVCSFLCTCFENEDEDLTCQMANSWIFRSIDNSCRCASTTDKICEDVLGSTVPFQFTMELSEEWLIVDQTKVKVQHECIDSILATTGFPFSGDQVIGFGQHDLDDAWTCQQTFPGTSLELGGATGGILDDGTIVICGGSKTDSKFLESKCYFYGGEEVAEIVMTTDRYLAASIVITEGSELLITGGYKRRFASDNSVQDSVEIVSPKMFPRKGAEMPFGLANHCLVKLNDSLAIAVGGRLGRDNFGSVSGRTFFYQIQDNIWIGDGPALSIPREGHFCGTVIDPSTDQVHLVIAGGFGDSAGAPMLDSSEILAFDDPTNPDLYWTLGPQLPKPLTYARFVPISSGSILVLMGGSGLDGDYNSELVVWTCSRIERGCSQRLLDRKWTNAKSNFIPIKVKADCSISNEDFDPTTPIAKPVTKCGSNIGAEFDNYVNSRELCCRDGNICNIGEGQCSRDSDCLGDLVCGCSNCKQEYFGVFQSGGNCCAVTKENCNISFSNELLPYQNESDYCVDDIACSKNIDLCVGDCKTDQSKYPYTCCVPINKTALDNQTNTCTLAITGISCLDYKMDGHYVRFLPSAGSTWSYLQVGNYHAKLFRETLTSRKRMSLLGDYHILDDINDPYHSNPTSFQPPGWVIQGIDYHLFHRVKQLAFANIFTLTNSTASWFCNNYELGTFLALIFTFSEIQPPVNASVSCAP